MLVRLLLCAAGLVVLTLAADHLVMGSSRLAERLQINPVVVGVVVIGIGTSAPELLVSATAAGRGDTGLAIGNITGSNTLNLTLVLGVAAVIAPIAVTSSVIRREIPLAVAGVVAFAVLARLDLGLVSGAALCVLLLAALALLIRWARMAPRADPVAADVDTFIDPEPAHPATLELLRSVLGLIGVLVGAQLLVVNASSIAEDLGVPEFVIGFTLVALGTSLPELVTTIQAQRRGETDLVVGNLFGSNLFNSLGGGAAIGLASADAQPARAETLAVTVMLLASLLAWALIRRGQQLTRPEGVALLVAYLGTLPLLLA